MIIANNLYHSHHTHLLGRRSQVEIVVVIYSFVISDQASPVGACTPYECRDRVCLDTTVSIAPSPEPPLLLVFYKREVLMIIGLDTLDPRQRCEFQLLPGLVTLFYRL